MTTKIQKKKEDKHNYFYVFHILKKRPIYFIWLVYLLMATTSIVISTINNGFSSMNNGEMFLLSITIISPIFVDFIIQTYEEKILKSSKKFLSLKAATLGFCLIIIFLSIIFFSTILKSNIVLQLIVYFSSASLSLYMYCINKMEYYYEDFKELDDKPYHEMINEETKKLIDKTKQIKIENNNGKEIIL